MPTVLRKFMANPGLDEATLKAAMLLRSRSANAKAREAAAIANAVEPRAESAYNDPSSDKPNGMLR